MYSEVQLGFGKSAKRPIAVLLLKDPGLYVWLRSIDPYGPYLSALNHFDRLKEIFDTKPWKTTCASCGKPAKRLSVHNRNADSIYPICLGCDPYSKGANFGELTVASSYNDAIRYGEHFGGDEGTKKVISAIARAKGLSPPYTSKSLAEFFKS